ncbi:uroporphyrinogen-III C-methyltransferase [Cobetia sp. 1CM21F]|uniref:uroporphyrinogen-III C-methyltransferase n=1 Tax=Cobetia sp. 1CM21F TaxID=2929163 RepID=UPI0032B70B99
MEFLNLSCDPSRLQLCLIGGGQEAVALAERFAGLGADLCVYGDARMPMLETLCGREGWEVADTLLPVPAPGQLWLVATGSEGRDRGILRHAREQHVMVFAPSHPRDSSVRLPPRLVAGELVLPVKEEDRFTGTHGQVALVSAGPGDPELLTLKALRHLQQADVIIHDRLVSHEILALANPEARRLYVGKARSDHSVPQEGINQALVDYARAGHRVVRLKGGDAFIFGRGGEELETLAGAGISFEVVPGITAASGCAAYAGIPLTHRDHAQSVRFVTGHLKDGSCDLDWEALARPAQTLVFYMGLGSLGLICEQLIANGLAATTPIALVEQGTTARQRVHVATLADMPAQIAGQGLKPPTLIIVGDVVKLHDSLKWFSPNANSSLGWEDGKHPTPLANVVSV